MNLFEAAHKIYNLNDATKIVVTDDYETYYITDTDNATQFHDWAGFRSWDEGEIPKLITYFCYRAGIPPMEDDN